MILVQPRDRAVVVGDSTFFGVIPSLFATAKYQWRFNGSDIAGQTHAILSVDNVDLAMAGSYSVVVSNDFGSVESSAATLIVRTNFVAPTLIVAGVNADSTVNLALRGEPLTYYRIQSSSNLTDWTDERSFPLGQRYIGVTSVILNRQSATSFTVPFGEQSKFFRALVYQPTFDSTNSTLAESQCCVNELRKARFAKEFWSSLRIEDGPGRWPGEMLGDNPSNDLESYVAFVCSH